VLSLTARPRTTVYVDAGNSNWMPVAVMAGRLRAVGVSRARGFALNVSNFNWTASERSYGRKLSAATHGAHFVIDTSRNGRGPAPGNEVCNPPGRGLGVPPSTRTATPLADAYLWVKIPGESDGACHGGPSAGVFWTAYALGLAARAQP
jgi:endoglucanase